jgi:hypothetical protein
MDTATPDFDATVSRLLRTVDGQVLDRWSAVDQLLDLRASTDRPQIQHEVDEALRTMPGRSLVTTEWWVATLHRLLVAARPVGSGRVTR